MQALVIVIVVGSLLTASWTTLLTCFVIVLIVVAVGYCAYARWVCGVDLPGERHTAINASYVAALETMITAAEAERDTLRIEVELLRSALSHSKHDPRAALFSRVGLSPGAPGWLVSAARKAYRTALHPDRHPAHRKQEAEKKFKLAEGVFDQITAQG